MEALSSLVKVTLPNYLSNLPIPDSFTGWFKLGSEYLNEISMNFFRNSVNSFRISLNIRNLFFFRKFITFHHLPSHLNSIDILMINAFLQLRHDIQSL